MGILTASELSLSFGARTLFDNLSFIIEANDKMGLIGRNGSGKTTVMRILAQKQEIDGGKISISQGIRIGYLDQNLAEEGDPRKLIDFVVESIPALGNVDERIDEIENQLGTCTDADEAMKLADELTELLDNKQQLETDFAEHHAHTILDGLGFSQDQHEQTVDKLSGGWRMRAHLAGLLFSKPHLLLLDEPTNHLDVPTVAWFGSFLQRYKGAFVMISHDREFLNSQVNRVVAIEKERTRVYPGNYDAYVTARTEEETILFARAKNVAKQKEDIQRFIDRFRAQANKAKAVQSRVKQLEKMEDIVLPSREDTIGIRIPSAGKPVQTVLRGNELGHDYGNGLLFDGVNIALQRGDKVALIGENGAGKTTLLRILAGEIKPTNGTVGLGNKVIAGYYAQHHTNSLQLDWTIFQEVAAANLEASQTAVRTVLGSLLFRNDDVEKKIGVLSGGERARVCLAKLIIQPTNLLMMDEPTNHLDLETSEALSNALKEFDGTVLFVSHNMGLIRTVAGRVWNLTAGTFEDYPGTYSEYEYRLQEQGKQAAKTQTKETRKKSQKKRPANKPKQQSKKKIQQAIDELEIEIEDLETTVTTLTNNMSGKMSNEERSELSKKATETQKLLDQKNALWEQLQSQLEALP